MVERKLESLLSSSSSSVVFAREQRDHPNGARCHPGWINCMKSILSTTRTTQSDIGVHLDRNLVHPCVAATLSEFQSVLKKKFNKLATTTTKSIHKWEKYFAIRFSCEISFDSKWKFGGFGAFAKWVQAYHIWLRTIQQDTADIESRALNRTQKNIFDFRGCVFPFYASHLERQREAKANTACKILRVFVEATEFSRTKFQQIRIRLLIQFFLWRMWFDLNWTEEEEKSIFLYAF